MDIKEIYGSDVEIRKLTGVKVMTPDGFKQVSMIKRSKAQGYYRVNLGEKGEIKASGSHKVLLQDGHFLYVNMLSKGMILAGHLYVEADPEWIEEETYLYDLLDVEGNIYLTTNGVVNHNCAFIENIDKTITAALPTLSTGGQVMLLSTPNGIGNYFHSTWVKAEMGENSFVPIKLPWQVHPERDQSWRDQQDADMGKRQAAQECDAEFLTSGDTFFDQDDMLFYEETYAQDPVERRGVDSGLWIWEYPDYSKSYAISADVARGDGQDYSTFVIWDIENATQVAEYKGQVGPKDFGAILCGIATEYNNALLSVENANIGWSTVEEIIARGYNNLYYSSNTAQDSVESYMYKSETGKLVPGFTTSPKTRPLLLSSFYDYIHQRAVVIRSKRLMTEMRTFVWLNGKAQAAQGCHDDLVMAAGQGLYIRDTALKLRQQGLDLTRASMGAFGNLNRREPGAVSTNYYRQAENPYLMQDPYGHQQDISWVLR